MPGMKTGRLSSYGMGDAGRLKYFLEETSVVWKIRVVTGQLDSDWNGCWSTGYRRSLEQVCLERANISWKSNCFPERFSITFVKVDWLLFLAPLAGLIGFYG